MGAAASGIVIECQSEKFALDDIAIFFFGNCDPSDWCDTRRNQCVYIAKLANYISIGSADFAELFFKRNPQALAKINRYFGKPRFAFAYNWFDSGGTYGYTVIENGIYKRIFRSLGYEYLNVYGEPLEQERPWIGGESYMTQIEPHPAQYLPPNYDLNVRAHVNMETGEVLNEYVLPDILLPKIMRDFLSFDIYDIEEQTQESKFYNTGAFNSWLETKYNSETPEVDPFLENARKSVDEAKARSESGLL